MPLQWLPIMFLMSLSFPFLFLSFIPRSGNPNLWKRWMKNRRMIMTPKTFERRLRRMLKKGPILTLWENF